MEQGRPENWLGLNVVNGIRSDETWGDFYFWFAILLIFKELR